MKTIFFEVEPWEKELLQFTFQDALLVEASLTTQNIATDTFKEAEVISVFINSRVTKEVIDALPNLKFIATRSTGFDHIDVEYCKTKGILVANVPEYGSNTVAEHTFALILSLTRKIYWSVNQSKNLNFEHDDIRGVDLFGKTMGIIGMGKIGINVLRMAHGFGMKILVNSRTENPELKQQYAIEYVDLDTLLQRSDVVSLHLPLTPQTKHVINKENILKMKPGSFLINTARGGLIDTEAIVIALDKEILAGVGLDVLEEEKELEEEAVILTRVYRENVNMKNLVFDHMLINHPHVLITPHNAFNSTEALARITKTTIENIKSYSTGQAVNLVQ